VNQKSARHGGMAAKSVGGSGGIVAHLWRWQRGRWRQKYRRMAAARKTPRSSPAKTSRYLSGISESNISISSAGIAMASWKQRQQRRHQLAMRQHGWRATAL